MTKVLILHAYSAENRGDGLLVRETLDLIREALGQTVEIDLAASYPETFGGLGVVVLDSQPRRWGYNSKYVKALRHIDRYDLVVAVGGGYLRGGRLVELAKASLVHGPQLLAAARRGAGVIYLPQSIGPVRFGLQRFVAGRLSRIEQVLVRDDRSLSEFQNGGVVRHHDLALLLKDPLNRDGEKPTGLPVLSVRPIHGTVPKGVRALARLLGDFDGYVQSQTGGNDDTQAMASLGPSRILGSDEFLGTGRGGRRVVVAVRLHAALMALNAGHLVIHLAYERKGFGAFKDLGLSHFVHNVNDFDAGIVAQQVAELMSSPVARSNYEETVTASRSGLKTARADLVAQIRGVAGSAACENSNENQSIRERTVNGL